MRRKMPVMGVNILRIEELESRFVQTASPIDIPPYADAGSPQIVYGGENLSLDASNSYSLNSDEDLSYSWDVNGDDVFGDATGVTPTLTAIELIELGLQGGNTYGVRVQVSQSSNPIVYSISLPVQLTYYSLAVSPGGPYFGDEGRPIILAANDVGDGAIYAWDLNGDGDYNDASGPSVEYTPADNGTYIVDLQVKLGDQIATRSTTVTAANIAPAISIAGATTVSRKPEKFTITAYDSASDLAGMIAYDVDWNGDGTTDESYSGSSRLFLTHSFATSGTTTFYVRATDKDGGVGDWRPQQVIESAPYVIEGTTLNWYLSDGDDNISVASITESDFEITESKIDGAESSYFYEFSSVVEKLVIYGQGGNDTISVSGLAFVPVTINGGKGDDTIEGSYGDDQIDGAEGNDVISEAYGNNTIDGAEGNDTITGGIGSDEIRGNEGNDEISSGDGSDYVDGGEGNDKLNGGTGDDLLLGRDGNDSLVGGKGNDLLFGGSVGSNDSLKSVWTTWISSPVERHASIVAITKTVMPTADKFPDVIDPGSGFDVVYNDQEREVALSQPITGKSWIVSTSSQLSGAIDQAQAGDEIYIMAGSYDYTPHSRNLAGVTITGEGKQQTVIHGSFIIDNLNDQRPTVISNLTLDHAGLAYVSYYMGPAYNTFAQGTFYLDHVEVSGPGLDHAAGVYFWSSNTQKTRAYITDSYIHDINDDCLSTWGGGSYTDSLVELYDVVGERAGSNVADQVLTAHNGMPVFVVGGHFADAARNVVAPDGKTTIDLYFATIDPGTRKAGIEMPITWSVIDSCNISLTAMYVYGTIQNSTIIESGPYYPAFMNILSGGTVKNNTIINNAPPYYPGAFTRPLRIAGNNVTVVDNVFENWNALELDIYGSVSGTVISGNIYQ